MRLVLCAKEGTRLIGTWQEKSLHGTKLEGSKDIVTVFFVVVLFEAGVGSLLLGPPLDSLHATRARAPAFRASASASASASAARRGRSVHAGQSTTGLGMLLHCNNTNKCERVSAHT